MTTSVGSARMVHNVEYGRWVRQSVTWSIGLAVVTLSVGAVTGDGALALTGPWLVATTVVPVVFGPRWFGMVRAQRFVRADEEGLYYGNRFFVPWALVETYGESRRIGRPPREFLRAAHWRPRGVFAGIERRRGLPLSDFDRNWRSNREFVAMLQAHVPEFDAKG